MHRGNKVRDGAKLVGRLGVGSGGQVGKVSDDLDPGRPRPISASAQLMRSDSATRVA
jgi:hypothetical protein